MYRFIKVSILIIGLILTSFTFDTFANAADEGELKAPEGMLLTWQQDPTTTMTIDWHTVDFTGDPVLEYRLVDANSWQTASAENHDFPWSERTIHRVELTGLTPSSTYEFRFGAGSEVYRFRTMPEQLSEPVRFAHGGDTRHRQEYFERTNRQVLRYDPDFIVIAGDFAYADGREDRLYRWYEWFEAYMNTLVTAEGRAIPILGSTGNHEVVSGYWMRDERYPDGLEEYEQTDEVRELLAPYYFSLFAFPGQPGYNVLDFGNYLSIILLDSDHANPIVGEQTEWLESVLRERQDVAHVIPAYHVPGFPSHRDPDHHRGVQPRVREHWVPLFEKYGVRTAIEAHDHTYKRTHPIRNGQIDPSGVTYIGDGAWGVSTRDGNHKDEWYIKRFASKRHAIITTLHGSWQHHLTVSEDGEIIDEYPQTPHSIHYQNMIDTMEKLWDNADRE